MTEQHRIEARKREHAEIAITDAVETRHRAQWDDLTLIPDAVPGVSPDDVYTSVNFLGRELSAPIVIAGMTGGHEAARKMNEVLAAAAQQLGLAIGCGSQRAALVDPRLVDTYAVVRDVAPDAVVIANIGASQLVDQGEHRALDEAAIREIVNMVGADFLAVHLNAREELVQVEGDRRLAWLPALANAVRVSPVPVIAKETGAGIARESAEALSSAGVAALDVGGAGGTNFALVEAARAEAMGSRLHVRLGTTFADWGISTAVSILEARGAGVPLIATGGIRTGLDGAKALALGATMIGIGRPALLAAGEGFEALVAELETFLEELRIAITLCGCSRLDELSQRIVVHGTVREWVVARGLDEQ